MGDDHNISKSRKIHHDDVMKYLLIVIAAFSVVAIFFIILFVVANSTGAISQISIIDFITGMIWKPSSGEYGAFPIIVGTLLVTLGAILIALPLGIGAAIFISEIAPKRLKGVLKPICEVFAGIPSVVYGFFGLIVLVPFLQSLFPGNLLFGTSWLAGSIILGIMALPTIISVSEDAMSAVPQSYREASQAMGASKWETTKKIIVPSAISGIAAAAILGIGRAIGETMAVMMVTGNNPLIPDPLWNIFDGLRTMTATLALEMPNVIIGSTHYSALFLMALFLMITVLLINIVARSIVRRTKKKFGTIDIKKAPLIFGRNHDPAMKCITILSISVIAWFISMMFFTSIIMQLVIVALSAFITWCIIQAYYSRFEGRSGHLSSLFASYRDSIAKAIFLTLLGIFVWMMATLFTNPIRALLIAIVAVAAAVIAKIVLGHLSSLKRQRLAHIGLAGLMIFVGLILVVIIADVVTKGLPAISWDFLTKAPTEGGLSGGIGPAIVGTLQLIIGTMLISFPLGILSGIYLSEYSKNTGFTKLIRGAIDILNGTPSVVFGLFGMTALVVFLGFGYSLIAGCITLALMVLPVIIRTTEEAVRTVPMELREASLAMGASKWETTIKVVVPSAFGGVVTGLILSLGRAAGETAPIMFTAAVVFSSTISPSILDPVMALPYHLYYLASEVPRAMTNQYGTALVLLSIVLVIFLIASIVRYKFNKKLKW